MLSIFLSQSGECSSGMHIDFLRGKDHTLSSQACVTHYKGNAKKRALLFLENNKLNKMVVIPTLLLIFEPTLYLKGCFFQKFETQPHQCCSKYFMLELSHTDVCDCMTIHAYHVHHSREAETSVLGQHVTSDLV